MKKEQKDFFDKAEMMLKSSIKKFVSDGESETVAITLSLGALESFFKCNGLTYDFYQEVLSDLETIYTLPVKTYTIYKKYGIIT